MSQPHMYSSKHHGLKCYWKSWILVKLWNKFVSWKKPSCWSRKTSNEPRKKQTLVNKYHFLIDQVHNESWKEQALTKKYHFLRDQVGKEKLQIEYCKVGL